MNYLEKLTNTQNRKPENLAAGLSSMILEIRKESIKQSLSDINTVSHRQDYVCTIDGVMYYDDSRAENVNATWFTFENIVRPVVWIAGGNGQGTDFSELKPMARKSVRALVCIGKDNDNLIRAFGDDITEIVVAQSIGDAVRQAARLAEEDDIVLFSPACHSDRSRENYEIRGNRFIASVKQLENEREQ